MTVYATPGPAIEFTPEGRIVTVHTSTNTPGRPLRLVGEGTRNLAPYREGLPPRLRRPDADPDLATTVEFRTTAPRDAVQERFDRFRPEAKRVGRHRLSLAGRIRRLLGRGRKDGV
ncbi:hypothetical protein Q0Z83_060630 [Actinoplanes sichuanensis]|uniref:Uncharacterized protein n=1 Tax=Actinoplanes sichuanensis TaxID=512349 RepID=A0ABW4A775_9ACTN|nr:hypothetical protein [Actinoplanes sichuanensis]BEL07872.1 hypothetical protein Q0Z83_060630 [Actinoplanes sichuanensis]